MLRDGTLKINKKLQRLVVEIYKTMNQKVVEYDFRIKILFELSPARSQRFSTNSLKFRGSLLWNSLSDEVKVAKSLVIFKQKNQILEWHLLHVQHLQKLVIAC